MIKNLSTPQLLLIGLSGLLLLVAAFSFILLRDPSAPLPFTSAAATGTAIPPSPTQPGIAAATSTPAPTRQTSYTPFATLLTPPGTITTASTTPDLTPGTTNTPTSSASPTRSPTPAANRTSSPLSATSTPTITSSPTLANTLSPGEIAVTGRVLLNGTPSANVTVEFKDDVAPRKTSTNQTGHYQFVTLAPGTAFRLAFYQADNPQLTPTEDIPAQAWLEGTMPASVNPIIFPDFEISLNLNDARFELQDPTDRSSYSAAAINSNNLIPFVWSTYYQAGSYRIELGPHGSDQTVWTSSQLTTTSFMWDGTLGDSTHVTAGTYWWRVAATKVVGNYTQVIYTQAREIIFIP